MKNEGDKMIDLTIRVTEDGTTIYGATIEIKERETAKKIGEDVREAMGEILIKHTNPKDQNEQGI